MTPESDLEPRPAELDALPRPALGAAQRAALWSRIEASAALVPVAAAPAAAAAGAGKLVSAKLASGIALATLALGALSGAAVDHFFFAPPPRVVVQTREVRVEVPVPAAPLPKEEEPVEPVKPLPPRVRAPAVKTGDVDGERQAVERVRMALVRRDAASALATLEQLGREFPSGHLVEERESLRMQALHQAGRADEARAAARAYLKRYPAGVFGPTAEEIIRQGH